MSLQIRRFGQRDREMVGLLARPLTSKPSRAPFLLCRPLGQEATRSAAMYRVLADRLVRQGTPVFTFDYHGTGDSPGEESDQTLKIWIDDIKAAHQVLLDETQSPVHWFAMGLACQLALRAAARAACPPAHLVLWEPVIEGSTYVAALFAAHRDELVNEYHIPWTRLLRQGRATEPEMPGDLLGFEIGQVLASEIRALDHLPLAAVQRRGTRITCGVHAEHESRIANLPGGSLVSLHRITHRTNWMLSQAMGSAIVPPEVLPALNATYG